MRSKTLATFSAAIFVWSIFTLAAQYLTIVSTIYLPSWLWILILVATLESTYFAAYFLNPRTPLFVRLVELSLWTSPLYFLIGGFKPTFYWSSLVVFLPWLIGREYGAKLRTIESLADHLGDQGASTVRWEYESLQHRANRPIVTEYFWHRFWFFNSALVIFSIVAKGNGNLLLWFCALSSGLTLQGVVYLFQLEILWSYGKAKVQSDLPRRWLQSLFIVILMALILATILPINYSPITAVEVGGFITNFFGRITSSPNPPPIMEGGQGPGGSAGYEELPQEADFGLMGVFLALVFFTVAVGIVLLVLFVIGWLVVTFISDELDRLRGLPRLALRIYKALLKSWRKLQRGVHLNLDKLELSSFPGSGLLRERSTRPKTPRGIRGMFRQLVHEGGKKGLVYRKSETPTLYGEALKEQIPEEKQNIEKFLTAYEQERYGEKPLKPDEQGRVLTIGKTIIDRIKG